jgi:hypothetical protein
MQARRRLRHAVLVCGGSESRLWEGGPQDLGGRRLLNTDLTQITVLDRDRPLGYNPRLLGASLGRL